MDTEGGSTAGSSSTGGTAPTTGGPTSDTPGTSSDASTTAVGSGEETGSGDTTGEPPMATCDGHPDATDDLGVTPGELEVLATFEHLSITWGVSGDTNTNAEVFVRLRPEGGAWREGTPLRRVPAGSGSGFSWQDTMGGSQFGLTAGTRYEVELQLIDADGGCTVETLEVETRAPLEAADGAPVTDVTPDSLSGALANASPGDVLQLQPGTYGGFEVLVDGTAEAPIVIRGQEGATVDGQITFRDRAYVILEGIHVLDRIRFDGSHDVAIRRCRVDSDGDGIVMFGRGENNHVADNDVRGSTAWTEAALGVNGDNEGEGIMVNGPGHVIEHNRVVGFRDCISFREDSDAVDQFNIDVLRNELDTCADDGIEADFCEHDCRVLENRLTNTFIAISSQPSLGGPTYFVRNSIFNTIHTPFKLLRGSVGDVLWHNTVVKNGDALGIYTDDVFSQLQTRNNLFLGGSGGEYGGWTSGTGDVARLSAVDVDSLDMNADAFGSTLGTFEGRIGDTNFSSLAEYQTATGATDAIEIDASVLASGVSVPNSPFPEASPADLSLADDSTPIDTAARIPGFNDEYAGAGPDRGAHEHGSPLPAYGPR